MEDDYRLEPLFQTEDSESQPKISPDSRWLAYVSDKTGAEQVYVCPFPDVNNGEWQVSTSGGYNPLWSPDGHKLFYVTANNAVMSVTVETEPGFRLEKKQKLFDLFHFFSVQNAIEKLSCYMISVPEILKTPKLLPPHALC